MSAMFEVSGVCAVLHQPMSGTRMTLQDPSPLLWHEGTPVFYDGRPAGVVTGMKLDGNLLRWHGTLAEPPMKLEAPRGPQAPMYEPAPRELIEARRLFGVADYTQGGEMTTRADGIALTRWTVARVSLLRSRPWPEVELRLGA